VRPRILRRGCLRWGLVLALLAPAAALAEESVPLEPEVVDLRPESPAAWSPRNLLLPLTSLFVGGTGYWYDDRELLVDTTPSGAIVDLFYIRSNFQKRYEQAETPVKVILPSRLDSLSRDALRIRAFAPGHQQRSITLKVHTREEQVILDLDPLPNRLEAVAHRYFAGRGSLALLTRELVAPRLQKEPGGFAVFLAQSGMSDAAARSLEGVHDALVEESFGQQLGEDLAVRITLRPEQADAIELRSRQSYDAARELHVFAIDLVPSDGGARAVEAALAALARIGADDLSPCALRFDAELRSELDPGALSRALEPRGEFTDRYVRAAMRRMGEVARGGVVSFLDGSSYRPSVPIELDAALSQAGSAVGFLSVLRAFAEHLEGEHAVEALRSLIAPELDLDGFGERVERARAVERACLAAR
jgi:hypothetical protein